MSLNKKERQELVVLIANNVGPDGKPLEGCEKANLERIEQLLDKQAAPQPAPQVAVPDADPRIKGHKVSLEGQQLVESGAEYMGCCLKNLGTEDKPHNVIREIFTRKDGEAQPEAVMVQQGKAIIVGRKFDANFLDTLAK